jgi:hypothetical protein
MPVHGQAIGGPKSPGWGALHGCSTTDGVPKAKERLLHYLVRLVVTKAETTNETPEPLAVTCMDLLSDLSGNAVRGGLIGLG